MHFLRTSLQRKRYIPNPWSCSTSSNMELPPTSSRHSYTWTIAGWPVTAPHLTRILPVSFYPLLANLLNDFLGWYLIGLLAQWVVFRFNRLAYIRMRELRVFHRSSSGVNINFKDNFLLNYQWNCSSNCARCAHIPSCAVRHFWSEQYGNWGLHETFVTVRPKFFWFCKSGTQLKAWFFNF